jgi:DNA-binding response OmpR family regulator
VPGDEREVAATRDPRAGSIGRMTASNHSATSTELTTAGSHPQPPIQVSVLLYSDDYTTRDAVRAAVGRRPAKDVEVVRWHECATADAVISTVDHERFDILVLDGEAAKVGGLGLARQLKNEIFNCPPIIVLTGRPQDNWLAAWSQADLAVPHPLDPIALSSAVTTLARSGVPTA